MIFTHSNIHIFHFQQKRKFTTFNKGFFILLDFFNEVEMFFYIQERIFILFIYFDNGYEYPHARMSLNMYLCQLSKRMIELSIYFTRG